MYFVFTIKTKRKSVPVTKVKWREKNVKIILVWLPHHSLEYSEISPNVSFEEIDTELTTKKW